MSGKTIGSHSFWQHYWLTQFLATLLAHTISGNSIGPHSFWQHYWPTQFLATLLAHTISGNTIVPHNFQHCHSIFGNAVWDCAMHCVQLAQTVLLLFYLHTFKDFLNSCCCVCRELPWCAQWRLVTRCSTSPAATAPAASSTSWAGTRSPLTFVNFYFILHAWTVLWSRSRSFLVGAGAVVKVRLRLDIR